MLGKPLKLLSVSQYSNKTMGGAERYIHELNPRLEALGFSIEVLSTDQSSAAHNGKLLSKPFKCLSAGFHNAWRREVAAILEESRPDCLLVHFTVPALVDVAVRVAESKGIPIVLMYHSDVTGPSVAARIAGWCYDQLIGRTTIHRIKHLLVASDLYLSQSRLLGFYDGAVSFAPPGVSLSFDSLPVEDSRNDAPYFLFVGKPANSGKGFQVLLNAWRNVYKETGVELFIAGDIPSSASYIKEPGCKALGYVDNDRVLTSYYQHAQATVLPSVSGESFGMVLAESLVCGTPVIGTKIGGVSAVVADGFNGYSVAPNSINELITALYKTLDNQVSLRQFIAKSDYRKRFSWDNTAETIAHAVHQSLVARP